MADSETKLGEETGSGRFSGGIIDEESRQDKETGARALGFDDAARSLSNKP